MITTILVVLLIGSTLVLSTAAIVTRLLPGISASSRFSIWQIAVTSLMLLPIGVFLLPEIPLGLVSKARAVTTGSSGPTKDWHEQSANFSQLKEPIESHSELPAPQLNPNLPVQFVPDGTPVSSTVNRVVASSEDFVFFKNFRLTASETAMVIWLSLALTLLTRTLLAHFRVAWANHSVDLKIDSTIAGRTDWLPPWVDLTYSDRHAVPVTIGIWRRQIILPTAAVKWPTDQVRMVLKHELAHVQRRDVLWQLVTSIVTSFFWFQPLIWWANRELKLERERACDDRVITGGEQAADYATVLLQLAAIFSGRTTIPNGALSMTQKPIEHRLATILSTSTDRSVTSRWFSNSATVIALLVVFGVCSVRPFSPIAIAAQVSESVAMPLQQSQLADDPLPEPSSPLVFETYSVGDLLAPPPFMQIQPSPRKASTFSPNQVTKNNNGKSEIDPQPLVDLIQNTIQPDSWKDNGLGGLGTVVFHKESLRLVISQKPKIHDMLQNLLTKLRELNDLMIDLRGFLTIISDDDLEKSLRRNIPTTPAKISRYEAASLNGLARVNDSISSFEFLPISQYNGATTRLVLPALDINLTKNIDVVSVTSADRKSIRSKVMFNDGKLHEPEFEQVKDEESGQIYLVQKQPRAAFTLNAESGQCMTVDVTSLLPAGKTGYRAILVLRPYVMAFK